MILLCYCSSLSICVFFFVNQISNSVLNVNVSCVFPLSVIRLISTKRFKLDWLDINKIALNNSKGEIVKFYSLTRGSANWGLFFIYCYNDFFINIFSFLFYFTSIVCFTNLYCVVLSFISISIFNFNFELRISHQWQLN